MAYHYIESGLDNVWLENGYEVHETPYGTGVSIEDTEGLHRAIGEWLVSLPKPFNGAELRFIRLEMELTQRDLADILGVDEQALRRWEKARDKRFNGAADRLLRAVFNEYLNEESSIRAMVERLVNLNEIDPIDTHFCETEDGWTTKGCLEVA